MSLERRLIAVVPQDSTVALQADNLLGDRYINITRGKSSNPVAPGGVLVAPPVQAVDQADMMKAVQDMLHNVDTALGDVESGNGSLGKLFKGDDYDQLVVRVRRFQRQIAETTNRKTTAGKLLYDDVHYRRIQTTLKRLDDTLADLQAGRGQMGALLKDPATYDQLVKSISSVDRSLAELEAGRGRAGGLLSDDRLYTNLTRQVNQLTAQVDALNAGEGLLGEMLVSTQLYESLNGSMRQLQTGIADFRANPKKYLWVKVFGRP
jgi:phospholipid/cholesterol/gamma-HCH transport system substrate-binding protein